MKFKIGDKVIYLQPVSEFRHSGEIAGYSKKVLIKSLGNMKLPI